MISHYKRLSYTVHPKGVFCPLMHVKTTIRRLTPDFADVLSSSSVSLVKQIQSNIVNRCNVKVAYSNHSEVHKSSKTRWHHWALPFIQQSLSPWQDLRANSDNWPWFARKSICQMWKYKGIKLFQFVRLLCDLDKSGCSKNSRKRKQYMKIWHRYGRIIRSLWQ